MATKKVDYEKLRSIAEDMFIRQGINAKEIADTLEVSEQTLVRWRKGREGEKSWDDRRNEAQLTPVKVKELLMTDAYNVAQGNKPKIDADSMSKLMSAIDRLDKKVSSRVVADVFKEFDNWLSEVEPRLAIEMLNYHKRFIQYRIGLES